MADGVRIVPGTAGHAEGFNRCVGVVANERRYLNFQDSPSLASSREWIDTCLEKDFPFFVALVDKELVGWCDIARDLSMPGRDHGGRLTMAVLPAQRGQGIGQQLLQATLGRARDIGLERVELEVYADNDRAITLYRDAGFVIEGYRHRARKLGGVYSDIITMATFF